MTRLLALSVLALCSACGDGEASGSQAPQAPQALLRETIVLAHSEGSGAPAPVIDQALVSISLERNQEWRRSLSEVGPERHTVVVDFDGGAPRLFSAVVGEQTVQPLRVVESRPGQVEATLLPGDLERELVVRALGGPVTLTHLKARRWAQADFGDVQAQGPTPPRADERAPLKGLAPSPQRLEAGWESRQGWRLPGGSEVTLPVVLPAHASRLMLAAAQAVAGPRSRPAPPLQVSWRDDDGSQQQLPSLDVSASAYRWHEASIDVTALAGRSGALMLSSASSALGRRGAGPERPLLVAVPELLCEQGRRRPNLILISLDTTRPDHLGLYGYSRDTSPRLDAFARDGVVFEQALSVSAYTLPAHATMLTGVHPLGHGVVHPGHALDAPSLPLMARVLQQRGWATRAFTGGGYLSADYGFAAGFGAYGQRDPLRGLIAEDRELLLTRGGGQPRLDAVESQNWNTALSWIRERSELPFFLFLQTFAIHDYRSMGEQRGLFGGPADGEGVDVLRPLERQLREPYGVVDREQLQMYYDEAIALTDQQLGRLFDLLDELSLGDDTVVVITADHGESFGEHGSGAVDLVGHNFGLWDEQVAVPLIIVAPGLAAARRRERVSLVDLAPTMLELLDVPIPEAVQGRSLVGWLAGDSGAAQPSPALLDLSSNQAQARALYSGRYKLVVGDTEARVTLPVPTAQALFDLANDPGEQTDVAADHPDVLARIADDLALAVEWMSLGARVPNEAELDEETLRQLQELGYLER